MLGEPCHHLDFYEPQVLPVVITHLRILYHEKYRATNVSIVQRLIKLA